MEVWGLEGGFCLDMLRLFLFGFFKSGIVVVFWLVEVGGGVGSVRGKL